jgi:hypothetical protein
MLKRLFLSALALVALASAALAQATTKVPLAGGRWTDLGPGPMQIMGDMAITYAISATSPSLKAPTEGFRLNPYETRSIQTSAHVWAAPSSAYGGNAFVAPIQAAAATSLKTLASTGPPLIVPSSGQFGANGAVVLSTALNPVPPFGFFFFPSAAIDGAAPPAFHWGTCSDGTHCTIYQEIYNSSVGGNANYVASPTPYVSVAQAAYTQLTGSNLQSLTAVLPGGTLGPDDGVRCEAHAVVPNNSNNKIIGCAFGSPAYGFATATLTTSVQFGGVGGFRNQGAANRQALTGPNQTFNLGTGTNVPPYGAVDTTQTQSVRLNLNLANAGDFIELDAAALILVPAGGSYAPATLNAPSSGQKRRQVR